MSHEQKSVYLGPLQHLPLVEDLHGVNTLCVFHLHHSNLDGWDEDLANAYKQIKTQHDLEAVVNLSIFISLIYLLHALVAHLDRNPTGKETLWMRCFWSLKPLKIRKRKSRDVRLLIFCIKKRDGTQEPDNVGHKTVAHQKMSRVTKVFPAGGVTQY